MEKPDFNKWLNKLGGAWIGRNPKAAACLFAKNCVYYESVFEMPFKTRKDILKLWLEVPKNQKVKRALVPSNERQLIDGIFQISLNNKGLCTFFKQWRSIKKF